MRCERCGAEEGVGYSVQEEWVGFRCLWDLERPEVKLRLANTAERSALRRYIKQYGVNQWPR